MKFANMLSLAGAASAYGYTNTDNGFNNRIDQLVLSDSAWTYKPTCSAYGSDCHACIVNGCEFHSTSHSCWGNAAVGTPTFGNFFDHASQCAWTSKQQCRRTSAYNRSNGMTQDKFFFDTYGSAAWAPLDQFYFCSFDIPTDGFAYIGVTQATGHTPWIASLFELEYGYDYKLYDVYSTWKGLIGGSYTTASAGYGGNHYDLKQTSGLHRGMIRTGKLNQVTHQKIAMEVRKAGLALADVKGFEVTIDYKKPMINNIVRTDVATTTTVVKAAAGAMIGIIIGIVCCICICGVVICQCMRGNNSGNNDDGFNNMNNGYGGNNVVVVEGNNGGGGYGGNNNNGGGGGGGYGGGGGGGDNGGGGGYGGGGDGGGGGY